MAIEFEKYAHEGNSFVKTLATELGHPDEIARTGIVLRAALLTLRDRITMSESLNLLSQLPMFLKGLYVENWKYSDKPVDINTKEEFLGRMKSYQEQFGESEFNWDQSSEEIFQTVMNTLGEYVSEGEFESIVAQLPKEIKSIIPQRETH